MTINMYINQYVYNGNNVGSYDCKYFALLLEHSNGLD